MEAYLKRQLAVQRRGTPLQGRPTERALYAACDAQASRSTSAHPLTLVREHASKGPCWEGYERTPGTKKYADGSCRKKGSGKKKMAKKEGEASADDSSSSSDGEEGEAAKKKRKKKDTAPASGDKTATE